jgi:hypothetical protein
MAQIAPNMRGYSCHKIYPAGYKLPAILADNTGNTLLSKEYK